MVRTFDGRAGYGRTPVLVRPLRVVATLRLVLGLAALLGAIVFLEGTSWDIQWHSFIGRDRTLIPPHIMMLGGVTLSGVVGLLSVLIESLWARRNQIVAQYSRRFAGIFSGSFGAYIVGYAALTAAVAFPLDAYWHTLYGIDVAIWAPFHVMFVASMGIVALGATYMLLSASHLAARIGPAGTGTRRASTLGVILALATMLSLFTLLLFDALKDENFIHLGFTWINLFPFLSSMLVAFTFVAAAYALPWRWSATCVAACYLLLAGIMAVFVQPATDWLLSLERLSYIETPPSTSSVALEWFWTPLLVALLIDVIMHQARRKQWLRSRLIPVLALVALLSGALPVALTSPFFSVTLITQLGMVGYLSWLLLGLVGAYVGALYGQRAGESVNSLER